MGHRASEAEASTLEAAVREHRPSVVRFLTRLSHDASLAEDLTQETFVTALQHVGEWRGDGTLRGWLMSIARSRWLMSKRAPAARHQPADDASLETLGLQAGWGAPLDPEVLTAQLEQREHLEAALATLDDEAREVLTLRELEELSGEETAQALGLSLAAMKSRLHRARLALVAQVKRGATHG